MSKAPPIPNDSTGSLLRELPSVDQLLRSLAPCSPASQASHAATVAAARLALQRIRSEVKAGEHDRSSLELRIQALNSNVASTIKATSGYSLRPVINATGVILHTNLGRAPLSQRALAHILETAGGYCNLELDLESGKRGRRERIAEQHFLLLLATRAKKSYSDVSSDYGVFVANNCAGATFLTLNSLASGGGEVIVSRGELVEIGGGFRIPEILAKAGATLREVGTTNKTRLSDYRSAVSEQTKLILRVSRSNFRISGFTERPDLSQLVRLGKQHRVPVFEDQGTGAIAPLSALGAHEGCLIDSVKTKVDVVAASGDKLLGGPQAGLIFGRCDLIDLIGRNPLARAFRVDKLSYAALEATLLDYLDQRTSEIPVIRMIGLTAEEIRARAEAITRQVICEALTLSVKRGHSVIGGGTTPGTKLPTFLLIMMHKSCNAVNLSKRLRNSSPSVIARIVKNQIAIDLRTVPPELDAPLTSILNLLGDRSND